MAIQDTHKQEASRSIDNKSSEKCSSEMAIIASLSKGATNHVDWRATMVADQITKTKPLPGDGSIFLAKREC
jgi:hypothetical protein